MADARAHSVDTQRGNIRLWYAVFGAPTLWFVALTAAYFLVPWSCSHDNPWPLHIIMLLALAGSIYAGLLGYRIWRDEGRAWSDDQGSRADRSRFMSEVAMGSSALFSLILLGKWAAIFILGPCIPLPRVPFTPDVLLPTSPPILAHPGAAIQPHDLWSAWSTDPAILLALLWGGVLYGAGLRFAPKRIRARAMAFAAGCFALLVALISPLHALSEALFSAHMAQHTLLIAVAAPLIVLGRPVLIALWALPRRWRRALTEQPVVRGLARSTQLTPLPAFLLHAAVLWLWHVPALYQASLSGDVVHAVQHASFFLTAVAFWHALFHARRRHAYGSGVFYTFATAAHTGVLGALLALAPTGWYPRYAATTEAWGLSLLEDQQLAGLIMWVPGGLLYTAIALALLAAWLRAAETRIDRRAIWKTAPLALVVLLNACDTHPGIKRQALDARTAAGLTTGDPAAGKKMIARYGCGACHTMDGIKGARGLVGPPLNGIGRRLYLGGVITNSPENMARWIVDPRAIDPLTVMPKTGVTLAEARDIAAYLYTLK